MTWNTLALILAFIGLFAMTVVGVPIWIMYFSPWFAVLGPVGILSMGLIVLYAIFVDTPG